MTTYPQFSPICLSSAMRLLNWTEHDVVALADITMQEVEHFFRTGEIDVVSQDKLAKALWARLETLMQNIRWAAEVVGAEVRFDFPTVKIGGFDLPAAAVLPGRRR